MNTRTVCVLLCVLFVLAGVSSITSAQWQPGYEMVYAAPVAGMIPLNTQINVGIITANGCQQYMGTIAAYIVWINPTRPPEYYVRFDSLGALFIWNRETIDAGGCH